MNLKTITSAALAMALTLTTASAFADSRDQRREGRDEHARARSEGGRPQERAEPRVGHAVPRDERSVPRTVAPPAFERRDFDRRDFYRRDFERREFERREFDRGYYAPRFYVPRPYRPGFALGFGIFFAPADAAVYVDGNYVGIVESFSGVSQPLALAAGWHRIEVQARGYIPVVFDVNVIPGQLIPYQGNLQPAYGY